MSYNIIIFIIIAIIICIVGYYVYKTYIAKSKFTPYKIGGCPGCRGLMKPKH